MSVIGNRIKVARKRAGLTQAKLGAAINIGKSSISEWESGLRSPDIDRMDAVAKALNTTVAYLMGWVDDPDDKSHIKKSEPIPFHSLKTGKSSGFAAVISDDAAVVTLGQRVLDIMEMRGESLESLGRKTGMSIDFLSNILHGGALPSKTQTEQLAAILDVDIPTLTNQTPDIKFLSSGSSKIPEDKITIFSRNARKLSPEEWEQLQSVARVLFKKVFDEDKDE